MSIFGNFSKAAVLACICAASAMSMGCAQEETAPPVAPPTTEGGPGSTTGGGTDVPPAPETTP